MVVSLPWNPKGCLQLLRKVVVINLARHVLLMIKSKRNEQYFNFVALNIYLNEQIYDTKIKRSRNSPCIFEWAGGVRFDKRQDKTWPTLHPLLSSSLSWPGWWCVFLFVLQSLEHIQCNTRARLQTHTNTHTHTYNEFRHTTLIKTLLYVLVILSSRLDSVKTYQN